MIDLRQGDCLELLKGVPDGSVDLILTDPPYGTMKNAPSTWDKSKTAWDTTLDHDKLWREINRVLRTNGACLLFYQEPYSTELITKGHANVPFSYRMIWEKDTFANHLLAKTAPVCYFEEVLAFFKKEYDKRAHPLDAYAQEILDYKGISKREAFDIIGRGQIRFFRVGACEFRTPTQEAYVEITDKLGLRSMPNYKEWQEVKTIDDEFKSKIKKVFNLPQGQKCKSNILKFARDEDGHHPTQKPVALLEDLIKTYSNEGDTVLDFTMGSGSTGVAALNTNRKFIGIELDPDYFKIAQERINQAAEKGGFLLPAIQ